jgi:hypothetical protein
MNLRLLEADGKDGERQEMLGEFLLIPAERWVAGISLLEDGCGEKVYPALHHRDYLPCRLHV